MYGSGFFFGGGGQHVFTFPISIPNDGSIVSIFLNYSNYQTYFIKVFVDGMARIC